MDFLLKKAISFFIEPLGMVFFFFFLGLFFLFKEEHKLAKIFTSVSFMLLFIYSYPPFSNLLVSHLEKQYKSYKYDTEVKYIHVLGSGHYTNKNQPISSSLTYSGTKRVLEGVIIYKNMPNTKLVFTGYKGQTNVPNAIMNKRVAIALGVQEKDIIINKYAKDTMDEVEFMKTLLNKNEKFILVTSASHMSRAVGLFKKAGLNPILAPTDFHNHKFNGFLTPPNLVTLSDSEIAVHEYLGMLWIELKQLLH